MPETATNGNFLSQLKKGKVKKPSIDLIYGKSGIGKSTFAADAPNPVFICTEDGANYLDVTPFKPTDFDAVLKFLDELVSLQHDFLTLVIDSLDHLEILLLRNVCSELKIKEINDLAYGKGYALALLKWQAIFERLKILREKMNVILICHATTKQINDPTKSEAYDRFELKLNPKAAAFIKEMCDSVLFASDDIVVVKDEKGKAKAYGTGRRVLYTQSMPGHEGKNRYGLPYELPLSYEDFNMAKIQATPEKPETLTRVILTHIQSLTDLALKEKVNAALEAAGMDAVQLSKILNRLKTLKQEN